ncbi:MAG: hypothetical protein ACR2P2_22075 [Nakamurella sp.]
MRGSRAVLVPTTHVVLAVAGTAAVYFALSRPESATMSQVAEQLVRAAGITALLWLYGALLLGLIVASEFSRRIPVVKRSALVALHRQLNLVAIALTVVHLTAFVIEPGGSLLVALVPQTAGFGAFAYTLGVVGFYLAVLLGPTLYLRRLIGKRLWLVAHQFAVLSYAAALWHTLLLGGGFRSEGILRTLLWAMQVPLLGLLAIRLWRPRRPSDRLAAGEQRRFATGWHVRFRFAIHLGSAVAALVVLGVALAATARGLHATVNP